LVARLEKECAASPQAYRLKVILLASVSYLYVVLISALAVGGVVWSVLQLMQGEIADAIQVGLLSGLLALFLVPALWVKIPRPQGKVLQESDAPRLFAMIDTVRRKSGGGRIDEVILNDVFNTAIVQIPRLGILGWHRNVLVIGLPVLQTLSRKEFAAILAPDTPPWQAQHLDLSYPRDLERDSRIFWWRQEFWLAADHLAPAAVYSVLQRIQLCACPP